jgi:hypothetical protein
MLQQAEQLLTTNKNDAFVEVRMAFDKLSRLISGDKPLMKGPRAHRHDDFQRAVLESVRILNVLMLGIDPAKYRFFIANTPQTVWTLSGKCHVNLPRDYTNVPDAVFNTCFEFVVEVALNAFR